MSTRIEFLDPRAEPGLPMSVYDLKVDTAASGLMLGLLANGFPDSMTFLEELGRAILQNLPNVQVTYFDKGNPSVVADDQLLLDVSAKCHAVISAYGH
jgi:hypothetical protein